MLIMINTLFLNIDFILYSTLYINVKEYFFYKFIFITIIRTPFRVQM